MRCLITCDLIIKCSDDNLASLSPDISALLGPQPLPPSAEQAAPVQDAAQGPAQGLTTATAITLTVAATTVTVLLVIGLSIWRMKRQRQQGSDTLDILN